MSHPSKIKGTRAETAVVKHFDAAGIPVDRKPPAGTHDVGDVWVRGGQMVVEVKSHDQERCKNPDCRVRRAKLPSHNELMQFFREMAAEASRVPQCDIGVLVVKRPGSGKVGDWWAFCDHAEWLWLTRAYGSGDSYPMMLTVDTLIGQLVRLGWAE